MKQMIRLGGGTQDSGLGYTPFTIPDLYPPRAETVHWVHQWISATTSIPNCQAQAGLYVWVCSGWPKKRFGPPAGGTSRIRCSAPPPCHLQSKMDGWSRVALCLRYARVHRLASTPLDLRVKPSFCAITDLPGEGDVRES